MNSRFESHSPYRKELDSHTLTQLDKTLAKSRQIVQDSIALTKTTHSSKPHRQSFEDFDRFPSSQHIPLYSPIAPDQHSDATTFYEERILDLTEQLHNEEFMKTNYENALKDLRDRLTDIELKDTEKSAQQSMHIAEQKNAFTLREQKLLSKIDELESINRNLQKQAKEGSADSLKSYINCLQQEKSLVEAKLKNLQYGEAPAYGRAEVLEEEVKAMKKKYYDQVLFNKELAAELASHDFEGRMKQTTRKILALQDELRRTSKKYTQLEKLKKRRATPKSQLGSSAKRLRNRSKSAKSTQKNYCQSCNTPNGKKR